MTLLANEMSSNCELVDIDRAQSNRLTHRRSEYIENFAYPIGSACDRTWHTGFVVFSIT